MSSMPHSCLLLWPERLYPTLPGIYIFKTISTFKKTDESEADYVNPQVEEALLSLPLEPFPILYISNWKLSTILLMG